MHAARLRETRGVNPEEHGGISSNFLLWRYIDYPKISEDAHAAHPCTYNSVPLPRFRKRLSPSR